MYVYIFFKRWKSDAREDPFLGFLNFLIDVPLTIFVGDTEFFFYCKCYGLKYPCSGKIVQFNYGNSKNVNV